MRKKLFAILVFVALLSLMTVAITAEASIQDPYPIYGYVYDEDGAAVANATVKVTNNRTGEELNLTTDNEGKYVAELINMDQSYLDGDKIVVQAQYENQTGSNTTLVNTTGMGSRVDVTLGLEAEEAVGFDMMLILAILAVIVIIIIILIAIAMYRSKS